MRNHEASPLRFHWIRKSYERVEGLRLLEAFVTNEKDIDPISMPGTEGKWSTTRFVDPTDLRHDMHVNLESGTVIPFAETHVMEHRLYVLEDKAVYLLNRDWVEVEAGDYMWLRAFCPQACYASGPGRFRYLLYKDVNRHMSLQPAGTLEQRPKPWRPHVLLAYSASSSISFRPKQDLCLPCRPHESTIASAN